MKNKRLYKYENRESENAKTALKILNQDTDAVGLFLDMSLGTV